MLSGMMALAAGIAVTARFVELPSPALLLTLLPLSIPLLFSPRPAGRVLACFLLGVAWGCWRGQQMLDQVLPAALEGVDVAVRLCVVGLPESRHDERGESWRFRAQLLEPLRFGAGVQKLWNGQNIEIRSYATQPFRPGEAWDLRVRLRAPRGFVNPGGRDYQAWLLSENIHATGYVVRKAPLTRLTDGVCTASIDGVRYALHERLLQLLGEEPQIGSLLAVSFGDDSRLTAHHWDVFARTGTTHLMVISGMHISLVSLLLYRIVVFCARFSPAALRCFPASRWGILVAFPAAIAYTALAGFPLPAQRALAMICVFLGFGLLDRQLRPWLAYVVALLVIVVWQPLAVLQAGFWLSFVAVAALILGFSGRLSAPGHAEMIWKPQLLVLAALVCPLALAGQATALLSPLVNAVAIPLVNIVVVPFALLGCALLPVNAALALPFLKLALYALDLLWFGLSHVANWSPALPPNSQDMVWWRVLLAGLGSLWLLAPAGFPSRVLGVLLLLPLMLPVQQARGLLEVLMLDVGQGTAVVLRTRHHTLVYDTGAHFSERFDAGKHIVVPALRQLGARQVDMLMISHSDGDHAGGMAGLREGIAVRAAIAGEAIRAFPMQACRAGMRWHWDEVDFAVLHPRPGSGASNNNSSCVLRVEAAGRVFLLPGDIEAPAEGTLVDADADRLRADVLLVPHHGSRSSSTSAFVAAVQPSYALVSAGFHNRYGHPHPLVSARYVEAGARVLNTAESGAVRFVVDDQGNMAEPQLWRESHQRYWFAPGPDR